MSMSGAEKAGVFGAILLAAGIVAATLLFLLPGEAPREAPGSGGGGAEPAVGTALATGTGSPAPGDPATAGGPGSGAPDGDPSRRDLRKEIDRLRSERAELLARIEELEKRLEEAGVPAREEPEDPAITAAAALDDLRACGPETSPVDIDVILDRIVSAGEGGVETLKRFLAQDENVRFADSWRFSGGRFTAYPTLRIALIDALGRVGGVEGQAALVGILREAKDPLETLVLVTLLRGIRNVASVTDARLAAARRYVEQDPEPREYFFLPAVLDVLGAQPPEDAARDLAAIAEKPGRREEAIEPAVERIGRLPAETAIPTLARLAKAAEPAGVGEAAARALSTRGEAEATAALAEALPAMSEPARRAVYRRLAEPLDSMVRELGRLGPREGLEALARLERLEGEIEARTALLADRAAGEESAAARDDLDSARSRLDGIAKKAAALAEEIRK